MKIIRAEQRIPEVVRVLSDAFHDDPLQQWLCPDRANETLPVSFSALARMFSQKGRIYAIEDDAGDLAAALLLHPPGLTLTVPDWLRVGFWKYPLRFGWKSFRRLLTYSNHVDGLLDPMHAAGPHWYVDTLGVCRKHHGRGLGGRLARHVLSETAEHPTMLLTHKATNVVFYERLGFCVLEEKVVPGSDISSRLMLYEGRGQPPNG